jgi:hypothetical protein
MSNPSFLELIKSLSIFQQDIEEISKRTETYVHTQSSPSEVWTITHNLNKLPSVTVVDSANSVVVGDVEYLDTSKVKLSFIGSFSGKAYLN